MTCQDWLRRCADTGAAILKKGVKLTQHKGAGCLGAIGYKKSQKTEGEVSKQTLCVGQGGVTP